MEQINAGILKLMQIPGAAHMNGTKTDFGADRGDVTFDVLLEQKTNEVRTEVVNDRRKPDSTEKETGKEEVKTEKTPAAGKDEEENYDVAREAASAQIVWLMGQNAQELLVPEQENVASIEQPMLIVETDEPIANPGEIEIPQLMSEIQTVAELPTEELVSAAEGELIPEQTVESVQQTVEPQIETNVSGQGTEEPVVELKVSRNDADEKTGEAAVETPLFEDVEAAPIKVAEAPERTRESEPVERQVTEKLTNLLSSAETRVEIQLEPLELGKLTIELTHSTDGTLNILLSAENAQTRGLLERHMGSLQEALIERGQQSVQITVDRGEESQRQDNQQNNNFQDGSNGRQSEQHRRNDQRSGEDFLQQLRLGLIPVEDEEED